MRHPSSFALLLTRLLAVLFLITAALLPGAPPVAADGRPQPGRIARCTFEGINPEPNSAQAQVRSIILAFRCFDAQGRLVLPTGRLFNVEFFVDGVARDFRRAGEFDTEVVFIEFPNGLSAGVHTARVVVEGTASFAWSFRVTSGGASHQSSPPAMPEGVASTSARTAGGQPRPCSALPFDGLIAACAPATVLPRGSL